jgi:putative heme-binding domain-containing protein
MLRVRFSLMACSAAFLTAGVLCAQEGYSAADIQAGKKLYGSNCTQCHGATGDLISGVALGSGKFKRATTDNEIVAIMLSGIRDTPMPPANLSDSQAHQVVAYLRSLAAPSGPTADPAALARGRKLFETEGCRNCHRVHGQGSRVGPDLTNIGARHKREDIEQSIVDPNAEILPENRFIKVVTRDGTTVTGRILNEDTFSIQLIDSKEELRSFQKSDLSSFEFFKKSPMPSFRDKLTGEQLTDLVDYLASLKGL